MRAFALVWFAAVLTAVEWTTIATPPDEQVRIFQELAAKTVFSCYDTDDAGNITFVCFNHSKYARSDRPSERSVKNDADADLPRLQDADFQRIRHFPELRGIVVQFQQITDEGFAVLRAFPELELAALKNLKNGWENEADEARTSSALFRHLDGARGLRVWDTTHSFGFNDEPPVLQELQGFPELHTLIVDVGHADDFDELFPFIQKSPKLRWLKLHRCTFSEDQMRQILAALPQLERLDMKPRGNTPDERWSHQSLALVAQHPNLRVLRLIHGDALPLPWDNGLEHLVNAPQLRYLEWPQRDKPQPSDEAIAMLQAARPDLVIANVLAREAFREARDTVAAVPPVEYDWQIGPN